MGAQLEDMAVARVLAAKKKPLSAYLLWAAKNRETITKEAKTKSVAVISKKIAAKWKAVAAAEKAKFEAEAKKQKDAYSAYLATAEGKKAVEEAKAKRKEKSEKKAKRKLKKAKRAVPKDAKLKRPLSAYFMWVADNRASIKKSTKDGSVTQVLKKGGEMWSKMSEAQKKPFAEKAAKAKKDYEAYLTSAKGKSALESYQKALSGLPEVKKIADKKASAVAKKEKAKAKASKKAELLDGGWSFAKMAIYGLVAAGAFSIGFRFSRVNHVAADEEPLYKSNDV